MIAFGRGSLSLSLFRGQDQGKQLVRYDLSRINLWLLYGVC